MDLALKTYNFDEPLAKSNQTKPNHVYLIYMYKKDLALNNIQWLICHKNKPNQTYGELQFYQTLVIVIIIILLF